MERATELRECLSCSCFAVRRAARAITQHYDRCLRPTDLRATQFTLLVVLALEGPTPLSRVADLLGTERTTLTRNLRPLVARGLVTIGSHEDRRIQLLEATPKGVAAARRGLPYWREAQRSIAGLITPGARRSLEMATRVASRARSSGSRRSTGRRREG
jgi:DNA-binding MarR family transcriptional regulator